MKWTYANLLNKNQKKICDILGWEFDRYGVSDSKGFRIVEKFWDQEEFDELMNIDLLTENLESFCLKTLKIYVNYIREDFKYKPISYNYNNKVIQLNETSIKNLTSLNYKEMINHCFN